MRVAINATSIGGEGIGYYVRTLIAGLAACESSTEFIVLTDSDDLIAQAASWTNMETAFVDRPSPWWEQFILPEWLADNGIDLYHNPAFSVPLVKACRYMNTVHDCIPVLFPEQVGSDFAHYFRRWAPQWFHTTDHILVNSHHTAHDLRHLYGISPHRISVVHHTGNAGMMPVDDPEVIAGVHRRLGVNRPFILMVGRVELRKNVKGMLEAFAMLSELDLPPHLLVLAGARVSNAHDPQLILPEVGRCGDVLVTGPVSEHDLRVLYSSAAAFCFPSYYEGFGRPLLEAMQCGAPVVASRVSSIPEVGGDACLYVSPYQPVEMAQALYKVLTDDTMRAELVARGRRRAAEFTVERMTAETLAVYQSLDERIDSL